MRNKDITPIESLKSILLKMNYDLKKTLTENEERLSEQSPIVGYLGSELMMDYPSEKQYDPNEYPNYCSHPEQTLKVDEGTAMGFMGYCRYKKPVPNPKSADDYTGVWIPQSAEIVFTSPKTLIDFANQLSSKYGKGEDPRTFRDKIFNQLRETLPIGSVFKFKFGPTPLFYTTILEYENEKWRFIGYKFGGLEGTQWYEEPKDSRDAFKKFADNFSWWKQILVFIGLALVTRGLSTRYGLSANKGYIMELLLNGIVGGIIGVREFQKGNNVAAVFSFLFSALPALRWSDKFRNVKPEVFNSLIDDLSKQTFNSEDDVMKFYNSLSTNKLGLEKQRLFTQIFGGGDDLTKEMLEKGLKEVMDNPTSLIKMAAQKVGQTPQEFWKINFLQSVVGKELKGAGWLLILMLGVELFLGEELNDEQKSILEQVYRIIPESHKDEFVFNLTNNPDKVPELVQAYKENILSRKDKEFSDKIVVAVNEYSKEIIGPDYIELSEDPIKAEADGKEIEDTPENVKKYKDLGYKLLSEFQPNEELSSDRVWIGKKIYIKPATPNEK